MFSAWFKKAQVDDSTSAALLAQAQALQHQGQHDDAAQFYEEILAKQPLHEDALVLSARLEGRRGNLNLARSRLETALAKNPNLARAHADLGNILRLKGDTQAALDAYETALALDPALAPVWNNLGLIHLARDEVERAAGEFNHALARQPHFAEALRNLVNAKAKLGCFGELKTMLEAKLRDDPGESAHLQFRAELLAALGFVELKGFGAPERALLHFDRARELGMEHAEFLVNRGIALHDLGRIDDAVASYDEALLREPGYALARFHRALARLIAHRFDLAWDDYEARLASESMPASRFSIPQWDGGDIRGKTLLILAEQGLGDEIMFASCFAETIARAGHCVIDCAAKLAPLFRRSFPQATIHGGTQFDAQEWLQTLPPPAVQIHAGSLSRLLRKDLSAFPPNGENRSYLAADPGKMERWRSRLFAMGTGLKVGVSWRGGSAKSRSGMRSLTLDALGSIFAVPGAAFVSLQYDAPMLEIQEFNERSGFELVHFQQAIDDYDETAALVASLDLVISVCTAVIHLGGALGTPVWVLAPTVPEWRYGISGEAMPWYPLNRVLRQPEPGDWNSVIARAAAELKAKLA